MNKILRIFIFVMAIFYLLIVTGCTKNGSKNEGIKKEYRMQLNVGPQEFWGIGAAYFADLVYEKTDGQINVKPYYGSQLLKGAQLNAAQMVATGGIDLAFDSTINTASIIPQMNIFSLPFFIDSYENLDKLQHGKTGELIFEEMKKKGVMPLAWGENGFRQITNSKHPIRKPEDLEGLKIRVVGSPIFIDIFRKLGADPTNMNWGDALTAFQQRTVDGQENPMSVLLSSHIYRFHNHATLWNYLADPLVLYWSKKQWDAFPTDVQVLIQEAAIEAGRFEKALCRAGLDNEISLNILKEEFNYDIAIPDPIAVLKEQGMQIHLLSSEEQEEFKKALQPVYDKWVGRLDEDIYQAALSDMQG